MTFGLFSYFEQLLKVENCGVGALDWLVQDRNGTPVSKLCVHVCARLYFQVLVSSLVYGWKAHIRSWPHAREREKRVRETWFYMSSGIKEGQKKNKGG